MYEWATHDDGDDDFFLSMLRLAVWYFWESYYVARWIIIIMDLLLFDYDFYYSKIVDFIFFIVCLALSRTLFDDCCHRFFENFVNFWFVIICVTMFEYNYYYYYIQYCCCLICCAMIAILCLRLLSSWILLNRFNFIVSLFPWFHCAFSCIHFQFVVLYFVIA